MATMMATLADQAIDGLDVVSARGVVRVRDGHTTWLCRESQWDAALAALAQRPALDDEDAGMHAYSDLCQRVRGPVVDRDASPRGSREEIAEMLRDAISGGLIDEDDALAREAQRAR